ncbi:MAG TPA: efflux RND transporter periplasmic adaptor subunit [Pirellulales bacterium]|nr:efflux RND transporter periplasmic adaptor subunit [Pirellulales bacterium]
MSVVVRRPVILGLLIAALVLGGVIAVTKVTGVGTTLARLKEFVEGRFSASSHQDEGDAQSEQRIVVTTPKVEDVTITESFVCQIRSQRHIEVRTLDGGYIKAIAIHEGQAVKKGDMMFEILPILYKAKLEAEKAKVSVAQQTYKYTQQLAEDKVVSQNEVSLKKAEMEEAEAKAKYAEAELNFTDVKAPFDGIVDRLLQREGSLVKEGDVLTTLADNSTMWVYFNVPEKYYLHYMATRKEREADDKIELVLANGEIFPEPGKIGAIEADFNNENGNIKFRADFPNPHGLLRHGQTGTIKIRRPVRNALVIPQRATFEFLDKLYVWVVDEVSVVHQTLITTKFELEDIFVVDSGLKATDKIVLEGVREVEDGQKIEYTFVAPEEALKHQKYHAE